MSQTHLDVAIRIYLFETGVEVLFRIRLIDSLRRHLKLKLLASKAGGVVAQSAEFATPGEEILDSIPAVAARYLLVGWVSG